MKRLFILGLVLAVIGFSAFGLEAGEDPAGGETLELEYAAGFSVAHLGDGVKLVTDGDEQELLLVPEGEEVPEGYDAASVVRTPVQNVMTASTVQAALLRPLDVLDSVRAVTTPEGSWHIDEIAEGMGEGAVEYVGRAGSPDYELIQSIEPDLVFVTTPRNREMADKLADLGFNYAVVNAAYEDHPMGRMEWIKFMAAFYDRIPEAEEYFAEADAALDEVLDGIPEGESPRAIFGRIIDGKANVPKGGSYYAAMIEMIGGEYAFADLEPDETGFSSISMENFFEKAVDSDVFIYNMTPQHFDSSLDGITEMAPILADTLPMQEGNVWCFRPWFHQSIDVTHELIADLAYLLYPQEFDEDVLHFQQLD